MQGFLPILPFFLALCFSFPTLQLFIYLAFAFIQQTLFKLKLNLFKRFNLPISCIVFSLLGSAIGINLQPRIKYNSFSLTLVIIGLMKIFEAMINALILSENISIFAIWLPNIFATGVSFYLLQKKFVKLLG